MLQTSMTFVSTVEQKFLLGQTKNSITPIARTVLRSQDPKFKKCLFIVFTVFHVTVTVCIVNSGKLRHGTCHLQVFQKSSVYGNLKDQMKLDLCICEALSYTSVLWKLYWWGWLSITTNIN